MRIRSRVTLTRPSGAALRFDAWITGDLDGSAVASDYPIEDLSTATNHIQAQPKQINLEVRQSENPLHGEGESIFGEERIREAIRFLDTAGSKGEILELLIPRIGIFENMALLRWPGSLDATKQISFDLSLRQIEVGEVFLVSVPIEAVAPTSRAGQQEPADRGTQATSEVEVSDREVSPSLLAQLRRR